MQWVRTFSKRRHVQHGSDGSRPDMGCSSQQALQCSCHLLLPHPAAHLAQQLTHLVPANNTTTAQPLLSLQQLP